MPRPLLLQALLGPWSDPRNHYVPLSMQKADKALAGHRPSFLSLLCPHSLCYPGRIPSSLSLGFPSSLLAPRPLSASSFRDQTLTSLYPWAAP